MASVYRGTISKAPGRRRWRLLMEALRYAPLPEALDIARKAEAYLVWETDEVALSWRSVSFAKKLSRSDEDDETMSDVIASPVNGEPRYLH